MISRIVLLLLLGTQTIVRNPDDAILKSMCYASVKPYIRENTYRKGERGLAIMYPHNMIVATSGTQMVPLVRVASTSAWHAKVPLDLGALGICFPMTTTREAAAAAARAVRYPPRGERFWGPFYAPPRWGLSMREYQDRADDEVIAIGTIEHIDDIKMIHEVVATPGLDLVFIGPGDLATSMGHRGRAEHPDVQAAIKTLEEAIRPSSVALGDVATTPEQIAAMTSNGYRALVVGFDWSLLQRGIQSLTAKRS